MRLIDADAFKAFLERKLKADYCFDSLSRMAIKVIIKELDSAPSIKAEIVKHGRWEKVGESRVRCTACRSKKDGGSSADYFKYYTCCPHCGAVMDMSAEEVFSAEVGKWLEPVDVNAEENL
jgi:hypothetical protein